VDLQWKLLRAIIVVPRVFTWSLDFGEMCAPLYDRAEEAGEVEVFNLHSYTNKCTVLYSHNYISLKP